jgi:hypothetical protein
MAIQDASAAVNKHCDGDGGGVSDDFMRHSPVAEMKVPDEPGKDPDSCSDNCCVLISHLQCRIVDPCIVILIYIRGILVTSCFWNTSVQYLLTHLRPDTSVVMYPEVVIPFFDCLCLFVTGVDPLSRRVGEVHMFFIHTIWTGIDESKRRQRRLFYS